MGQASQACIMYNKCLQSLTQIATDILIGLGCNETLVTKMWYFVKGVLGLSPDRLFQTIEAGQHLTSIVTLFCQITEYLLV